MWIYCNEPKYALNIGRAVAFSWEPQGINKYSISAYIEGETWYICSAESEEKAKEIIEKLANGSAEKWVIK